jgi:outer membrane protein assembly factor BamB
VIRRTFGSALTVALLAALLVGCAAEKPKPTPLENFTATASGRMVWSQRLGAAGFVMIPAVRDGNVFVAGSDGTVLALAAATGATVWRADVGERLLAGVGSDGRFASVVTRANEVVTFDGGRELWRKRVPSAVVTPPLVAGERVFVVGVDRVVHAFDALDGRRLWTLQRPGDALTLAQPGALTPFRDTLLVGNGSRLLGVDPVRGTVRWDVALASPRGTNEVERLADLVGPIARVGTRFCVRAYQSAVGCADAERGATLWSRNVGGINAVAADAERVIGADASDRISAWRADNGDVSWTSERMLHRGLSGALAVGPYVIFGDSEGYVHFLASATGEPQLRLQTDGSAVIGTPVLAGSTLLVTTRDGGLFAFRAD